MPDDTITIIISGFIGAVVAYLGAILKDIVSARSFIDNNLLEKRSELYQSAWKSTELLSVYSSRNDITKDQYTKLSDDIHNWYFSNGGLYLSISSQKSFADLQAALINIPNETISKQLKEDLRKLGSAFRTELTNDLLSRRLSRKL